MMCHLLVLVAMTVEEKAILDGRTENRWTISAPLGLTSTTLRSGECTIDLVRTGVGTVNAALAVALVHNQRPVSGIVLLGVGGALSDELKPGDTVLATDVIQHDAILSQDRSIELMAPGEAHISVPTEERISPVISADHELRKIVLSLLEKTTTREGLVLSGNEFAGSARRKNQLRGRFPSAQLIDMEAAGVAQIARKLQIPFVVAKTVADRLDPQSGVSEDYMQWLESASQKARTVVDGLLRIDPMAFVKP